MKRPSMSGLAHTGWGHSDLPIDPRGSRGHCFEMPQSPSLHLPRVDRARALARRITRVGARALAIAAVAFGFVMIDVPFEHEQPALADGPSDPALEPLLTRLGAHAERFERMKAKASFTLTGHLDEVESDGSASGTKEMVVRFTATGGVPKRDVLRYTEDGKDKTSEAREKAVKKPSGKKARDFHLPFLASERARYTFSLVERDVTQPSHARIAFVPKIPAEDAFKGSAWVSETDGEVLSMGFSPSKNPTFVDHIDATLLFGLPTALGRAPSRLTFDARGSFLFLKRRYRGWATITDPLLAP